MERSTFRGMNPKQTEKELREEIRSRTMDWLWPQDVPKVFVTLRARERARIKGRLYRLTADELSRSVTVMMDRLSRRYFKCRDVKRGRKLHHVFVCEAGALVGLHYHGWIAVPEQENGDFCQIVEAIWNSVVFADNAVVVPAWSDGALSYAIKWKSTGHFLDHIDFRNVSLP